MEYQIIIYTLIFSAFFSGMEIAFLSSSKLRIALQKKQGTMVGKILADFIHKPSHFLGTTLIGNNIVNVVFSFMMAKLLRSPIENILPSHLHTEFAVMLLQTILFTIIILFIGEFIPKALFRINPDRTLAFLAIPFLLIYYLLYPFVISTVFISKFLFKYVFLIEFKEVEPVFNKVDLEHFIKQISPSQEANEIDTNMFENALYLTQLKVKECIVPRNEVEAIEVNASVDELKLKFIGTKLSRIIVYEKTIDNVLGYAHHFELTKNPASIRSVLIQIPIVTETTLAKDLLNLFIKERKSIAWVVDEFGGTAGIVTLEDILEEIFGEIEDEHDVEDLIEKQVSDTEFILSCRLEIDYLNETYHFNIPHGEYETLGGYILSRYEDIPKLNEKISIAPFEFTVLSVTDIRMETVKMNVIGNRYLV